MKRYPATRKGKIRALRKAAAFIRAARRAMPYTGDSTWNALGECLDNLKADITHHKKRMRETENKVRFYNDLLYEPPVGQPD